MWIRDSAESQLYIFMIFSFNTSQSTGLAQKLTFSLQRKVLLNIGSEHRFALLAVAKLLCTIVLFCHYAK